ncbi:MAG: DUF4870 domain-containing protein [Bacteroidetes bacterium]|nr:DUF4870 domain-containing protein [Bacteroidota bacterium]
MENEITPATDQIFDNHRPWDMEKNTFSMLMYLALIFGLLGAILAIVMWATNKEKSPFVDSHGKNILNWFISSMIYIVASIILAFFCIGYLLLFGVAITHLIFIIMGAIKANNGETFKFPLAIPFVK